MPQLYGDAVFDTTTVTTTEANTATRTPKADIIKFELSELAAAAQDLPTSYPAAQLGHITKGAALALKMRIELFEADYTDCVADAQQVMQLGYALYPSYSGLFRIGNEGSSEDILDVQYMENTHPNGTLGVMLPNSIGGWSSIDPLQALVDNYEMANGKPITDASSGYDPNHPYDNRDPRLKETILVPGGAYADSSFTDYDPLDASSNDYYSGNNSSRTGYEVLKFTSYQKDFDNIWNTGLDMMLIRYAEVLLSYAEAKIELGQIDATVYNAIDQVRVRAGLPKTDQTVYNSQSTLRTLVRRERRSEFAMEGLRWFDVQRWQIAPQVMTGQVYGARTGTVSSTGQVTFTGSNIPVETRLFDPTKNYLWPIPQAQRNIDKNLTQNPGYSQ
ncbi:MAG: RagB/SusD family nutrient uptake outer membrane protein [Arachidicoccus sp.]|nr:RagB/SusD family nutrient uptake outer membrane protein [Arachidicoccus sp.]